VNKTHTAPLALSVALLAALGAVLFMGTPETSEEQPVSLDLPERVGRWQGIDVSHCQNEACLATLEAEDLRDPEVCPKCGSTLLSLSLAEERILPKGTGIAKKLYRRIPLEEISVSVVVTGSERSGIHRPQWCLPAQGFSIRRRRRTSVPQPEREQLPVALLEIERVTSSNAGVPQRSRGVFAYWFTGNGRSTASHTARLFWMAFDSLVEGTTHRWAYVSILYDHRGTDEANLQTLREFIRDFAPMIRTP